jgi:glycosyltransferase involved in cell wall biosynthesis
MEKISVSIITFNEERNIARCLDSVLEIADEIVVVDSFSTDRTREICESYNLRFISHPFDGYIEQKNIALSHCSHPYVLSLDADEALSDTLKKAILTEKQNGLHGAYCFNRLTNYCGHWVKHCGWYPDVKVRLFSRESGVWGGLNPHDKFEFHHPVKLKHLSGDLLHYSYYTLEEHHKQVEYFTSIGAKSYFEKGKSDGLLKMYSAPVAKFIRDYFINLGFLDGKAGWLICTISAGATFKKYRKLRMLNKGRSI